MGKCHDFSISRCKQHLTGEIWAALGPKTPLRPLTAPVPPREIVNKLI
jgi:hypothetical protein